MVPDMEKQSPFTVVTDDGEADGSRPFEETAGDTLGDNDGTVDGATLGEVDGSTEGT